MRLRLNLTAMNVDRAIKVVTLVLLVLIANTNVAASDIYHWVDEDGIAHYSQFKPAIGTANVGKQKLENKAPPGDGEVEDIYNVEAQEKRMATLREEREQGRKNSRERNQRAAQQQPGNYSEGGFDYSNGYGYPPDYNRRPNRPRPPIVRPRPSRPVRR